MAIVPYKMLEEMNQWKSEQQQQQQRPELPPDPDVVQIVSFQKEMESVLKRNDLSESEKAHQFGQALQKFQSVRERILYPLQPTVTSTTETTPTPTTTTTTTDSTDERILESVPPTVRRKAKLLLQMLHSHPNVSYNEQGELEYGGKVITGSNIIDLVNDVLRHRKSFQPHGWQVFSQVLKEMNVPQEYVGNRKRWLYMQRGDSSKLDDSEDEEFFDTSVYVPESLPQTPKKIKMDPDALSSSHTKWEAY